jgi:hypothetical protein
MSTYDEQYADTIAEESLIPYEISLEGEVNDQKIHVEGVGKLLEKGGVISTEYTLHAIPDGMDPKILNAFLLTGHPPTAYSVEGAENPFRYELPRNTEYTRSLNLSDGNQLDFEAECHRTSELARSEYTLNGTVGKQTLKAPDPLVEMWVPRSPTEIYGHFAISWPTEDGNQLIGEVPSYYELSKPVDQSKTMHRYVTIQSEVTDEIMYQDQQASLFDKFPNHQVFSEHPDENDREQIMRNTVGLRSE